jgi:hypothetical protein
MRTSVAILLAAFGTLSLRAEEAPRPVPQAVAALEHLKPKSAAGPVAWTAGPYQYDGAGMLNTILVGSSTQPRIIYTYTADDERLFAFDVPAGTTHWTLRGLDNKVLRDFKQVGASWSVDRDYVYRDGLLLAALKSGGAVEHTTRSTTSARRGS